MTKVQRAHRIPALIGSGAIALSLALVVLAPPQSLRRIGILAAWLLWASFSLGFPIQTFRSGVLPSGYGGAVRREWSPARFWVGAVTYSVFFAFVFVTASLLCWYFWWH